MLEPFKTLIASNDETGEKYRVRLLDYDFRTGKPYINGYSWVAKIKRINQHGERDDLIIFIDPKTGVAQEAVGFLTFMVQNDA